ncbi:polyhydroxyalkanoic acid system family protein [Candidatus Woesearchaeota archaeon]|nr:polyhydroxyalkanoic acid system family protein [Candidatus Woesearchaeota archaeon]
MRIEYKHQHHQSGESVPAAVEAMLGDLKGAYSDYVVSCSSRRMGERKMEVSVGLIKGITIQGEVTWDESNLELTAQNVKPLPWSVALFSGTIEEKINSHIRCFLSRTMQ